jgi:hypothetical protein
VEIDPDGGDFGDPVSLSCDNLPAQTTCSFSDSVLTPSGNTVTSTLKVSTSAPGTQVGAAEFTVAGTSGALEHEVEATIDVTIDFTIAVLPSSATVTTGESASYTVTIGPLAYFDSEVTMSCSGLPSVVSCSFSPAAVTPNDADATSTLTVSTTMTAASLTAPLGGRGDRAGLWLVLLALGLPGICMAGLVLRERDSRGRNVGIEFALVVIVLAATLVNACGDSTAPSPSGPETFSLTVTGTAGSIGHSATTTLVVQ